jgi:hypothetical protein
VSAIADTMPGLVTLRETVRTNCGISDARHAGGMTMCVYLMEMRELYRWEHGIAQTAPLPRADVGAWLAERERTWAALEGADYAPLPIAGERIDPFDVATANAALLPHGLVYGAGIGRFGKPQFFLADLAAETWRDGAHVLVSGREHARDLAAAPAATRGGTIWLRTEALRRVLWEKVEPWLAARRDGAWLAALEGYGFDADAEAALDRMALVERETLLLHEQGEIAAGRLLGPAWEALLARLAERRAEALLRAVRDHLADCLVTLPTLIERDAQPSLHAWFASLDGLRRELYPRAVAAYAAWRRGEGMKEIEAAVRAGAQHWRVVGAELLAQHRDTDDASIDTALVARAEDPALRL